MVDLDPGVGSSWLGRRFITGLAGWQVTSDDPDITPIPKAPAVVSWPVKIESIYLIDVRDMRAL